MLRITNCCVLGLVVAIFAGLPTVYAAEKKQEEKVELYSSVVKEEGYDITITETERGKNYSVIKVELVEGPSVGSSMVIVKGWYDIAKIRGYKYFTNGKLWVDEKSDGYFIRVYYTNKKKMPLKKLLGDDYTTELQRDHDEIGYLAVTDYDLLGWGREAKPQE